MFGSLSRNFEEDPFFSANAHLTEHMRRMDDMFRDPFGMMGRTPMLALTPPDPHYAARHRNAARRPGEVGSASEALARHAQASQGLSPFDPFGHRDMFSSMFTNMREAMDNMHRQVSDAQPQAATPSNPNMHSFSSSSFYSYSNTGNGQPKVYQASSSTRRAPGGIMETRKAVRDSEAAVEKMSVGRHIQDRAHIIERSRNTATGQNEEEQNYVNLEEEEAPSFNREWQEKTSAFTQNYHSRHHMIDRERDRERRRNRTDRLALTDGRRYDGDHNHRGYRDREGY